MKIKARDIIPGWPKGRSTSPCHALWESMDDPTFMMYIFRKPDKFILELRLDFLYHKMQQAMINKWFARHRLGDTIHDKSLKWYVHCFQVEKELMIPGRRISFNKAFESASDIFKKF